MKASIEVASRDEANAIRRALADPEVKAFVVVMGNLLPLGKSGQRRVLAFIEDTMKEKSEHGE